MDKITAAVIGAGVLVTGVTLLGDTGRTQADIQREKQEYVALEAKWRAEAFGDLQNTVTGKERTAVVGMLTQGKLPEDMTPDELDALADKIPNQLWKRRIHNYANSLRNL